jgi:nucleotide-binding universal stress UspA family protein
VYRAIIAGYEGSERSADAVALGGRLARRLGAHFIIGHVQPNEPTWLRGQRFYQRARREELREHLVHAADYLPDGVKPESWVIPSLSPPRGLQELADEAGGALVAVGSTHRGPLGRVTAGSVAQVLLGASPHPVAVAPLGFHERADSFKRVDVAFDGSAESEVAFGAAAALASATGVPLRLVGVIEPFWLRPAATAPVPGHRATEHLDEGLAGRIEEVLAAHSGGEAESLVLHGHPAGELAKASEDAGLLVVGSRGYGPLRTALLGSVSAKLMRSASCPVLVVPRGAEED